MNFKRLRLLWMGLYCMGLYLSTKHIRINIGFLLTCKVVLYFSLYTLSLFDRMFLYTSETAFSTENEACSLSYIFSYYFLTYLFTYTEWLSFYLYENLFNKLLFYTGSCIMGILGYMLLGLVYLWIS